MHTDRPDLTSLPVYTIRVKGRLVGEWSSWLEGRLLSLESDEAYTSIEVIVPDQAALRGVLSKLWDFNLTLISVSQNLEKNDG